MNRFFALIAFIFFLLGFSSAALAADEKEKTAAPAEGAGTEAPGLAPGTDYICEADVFFVWKPTPPKVKNPPPNKPESARGSTADPIRDFFTTAGEQGVVEEEVRNRLQTKIPQLEQQAMEDCKRLHQDQTQCVSARMRSSEAEYLKLDFVTRRAMAEAINKDCELKLGKCLNTEASEIRCHLNRPPEVLPVDPPKEEAGKDGKKDAGAKKK